MNDQKKKPAVEQTPQETLEQMAERLIKEHAEAEKAKAEKERTERLAELNATLRHAISLYNEKRDSTAAEEMRKALQALNAFNNPVVVTTRTRTTASVKGDVVDPWLVKKTVEDTYADVDVKVLNSRTAMTLRGTSERFCKVEGGVVKRVGVGYDKANGEHGLSYGLFSLEIVAKCFAEAFGRQPVKR